MEQTKTNINNTTPNYKKESSPFSSGSTNLNKKSIQLNLLCNWSQVSFQVPDIKDLTFDPMIYLYCHRQV